MRQLAEVAQRGINSLNDMIAGVTPTGSADDIALQKLTAAQRSMMQLVGEAAYVISHLRCISTNSTLPLVTIIVKLVMRYQLKLQKKRQKRRRISDNELNNIWYMPAYSVS